MSYPPHVLRAIKKKRLQVDERANEVTYLPQQKVRPLSNPEEAVQMETYCSLIYDYGYPPEKLRVSEKIKIGSSTREVGVLVYFDWEAKDPFIAVACKKRNISDAVFAEAIEQGFSYAAATQAEYVWATSGDRNAYFEVIPGAFFERTLNQLHDLPRYDGKRRRAALAPRVFRYLMRLPATADTLLYMLALSAAFTGLSWWASFKNEALLQDTARLWAERGMTYQWVYHGISLAAIGISLLFGMVFMRSHEFFQIPKTYRGGTYTVLALLLFVPMWYAGTKTVNPEYWSLAAFNKRAIGATSYLWPFSLALPAQTLLVFGAVSFLRLEDRRKNRPKR